MTDLTPSVQIKCLTDGITCPCLNVAKCIQVCPESEATTQNCTDTPAQCCTDVEVCLLQGDKLNVSYRVEVLNDEPTRRFFIGKITVRNPSDAPITVNEVGIQRSSSSDKIVASAMYPVEIPEGGARDFSIEGSFLVPDGTADAIEVQPYVVINNEPPIVGVAVILDAEPDCGITGWNLSDSLRLGEGDDIPVNITGMGGFAVNNFTLQQFYAAGGSLTFNVDLETPIEATEATCGGVYRNVFTLTPVSTDPALSVPINSNTATLTLKCKELSVTLTPSSRCDDFDKWCLCKKDTLIRPVEDKPCDTTLIGYVLTLTKQNDSRQCCVSVNGSVDIDECVLARGSRELRVTLRKKTGDDTYEIVGEPQDLEEGVFNFSYAGCIEELVPGDVIDVQVEYHTLTVDLSNCATIPDPVAQTFDGEDVVVPVSDGTSQATLTDSVVPEGEGCGLTPVEIVYNTDNIPPGCQCLPEYIPPSPFCETTLTFFVDGVPTTTYSLGSAEYEEFLQALFTPGGIELITSPLVPDNTDSIEIRYFAIPPSCADSVINNAVVVSVSNNSVTQMINSAITKTVINPVALKTRMTKKNTPIIPAKKVVTNTPSTPAKKVVANTSSIPAKKVVANTSAPKVVSVVKKSGCPACMKKKQ